MKILMWLAVVVGALMAANLMLDLKHGREDRAYTFEIDDQNKMCAVAIDGRRSTMHCWALGQ